MYTPQVIKQVMCKQCLAVCNLPDGTDPHAVTWCGCCTEDHHHGMGALMCSPAAHGGEPCWNPPEQPARPDGCLVCRPVVHFCLPGDLTFPMGG